MHYNWNRYYDSSIGRYVSEDPIGIDGGINLYAYANNNPVNWVDPMGKEGCGPGKYTVPDPWGFKECCDNHDDCYSKLKGECNSSSRFGCDAVFCACTYLKCIGLPSPLNQMCVAHSAFYCAMVIEWGWTVL